MDRLADLCRAGRLRFVYVLGVARSNSTVVCKVLGDQMDGSVYEPSTPAAAHLRNHYARTILAAYDKAREMKREGDPVVLTIKDLSLFADPWTIDFILEHAVHVVLTVRDPLTQFPSLVTQFKTEFGFRNRVDALVRWPLETIILGYYSLVLGAEYVARGIGRFGLPPAKALLLPIAGWNLKSWSRIVEQFRLARERLGANRVTVLDAGLMRLLPDDATAALDAIAAAATGPSPQERAAVEHAGHSRMYPDSAWANEARQSVAIKPLTAAPRRQPKDAFEARLLAAFYPDYGTLFFDPANRLLPQARLVAEQPAAAPFRHLLEATTAAQSLARLTRAAEAAEEWRNAPRAAAE